MPNDLVSDCTIVNADDVYAFVAQLKAEAGKRGNTNLTMQLDEALHLGSSGLEILGGVRKTLIVNHSEAESFLGSNGCQKAEQVVAFVDRAFGRYPII